MVSARYARTLWSKCKIKTYLHNVCTYNLSRIMVSKPHSRREIACADEEHMKDQNLQVARNATLSNPSFRAKKKNSESTHTQSSAVTPLYRGDNNSHRATFPLLALNTLISQPYPHMTEEYCGYVTTTRLRAKCLHCVRTACALRAHCVGTACALRAHCSETHPMPPLYDTAKQQSQQDTH